MVFEVSFVIPDSIIPSIEALPFICKVLRSKWFRVTVYLTRMAFISEKHRIGLSLGLGSMVVEVFSLRSQFWGEFLPFLKFHFGLNHLFVNSFCIVISPTDST